MSLTGQVTLDLHFGWYHWQNINFMLNYNTMKYNEKQKKRKSLSYFDASKDINGIRKNDINEMNSNKH